MKNLATYLAHFHLTGFGWYWVVWFVFGFGVPEAYGLLRNTQDTLSWQFWGLERINFQHPFDFSDWTWEHYLIGVMLLAGFVWLFFHLVDGIWR
ncbi:MAG TPA: hypothetical protein VGG75_38430 [Trebonia sp.]